MHGFIPNNSLEGVRRFIPHYPFVVVYTMYIWYNLYKGDTMYTLSEFRSNIRKAFNDAEQGHEVVVERYGNRYQLVALVGGAMPEHEFESTPDGIERKKGVEAPVESTPIIPQPTPVKEGETEFSEVANMLRDDANAVADTLGLPGMSKTASKALDAAIRVSKEKTYEFCKHGNVKGMCKQGCK